MMLAGCSENGAEAKVRADLESMREIELGTQGADEISEMLGEEGKEDFDRFLSKAGDFDFDILGSEDSGIGTTVVTVRIESYCFGREYLRTWNDYLEKSGDSDFDQEEFYGMMMKNLSRTEDKNFEQEVKITCTDSEGDGSWTTDAADNYALRNAIFGGMLDEIASIAEVEQ